MLLLVTSWNIFSYGSDNIAIMIEGEVQFGLIQTQLSGKEIFLL